MSGSKKKKSEISSIRSSAVTTLTRTDLPPCDNPDTPCGHEYREHDKGGNCMVHDCDCAWHSMPAVTTPDLPADVRDRAAQAASKARFDPKMVADFDSWRAVVDAVTVVVAPEIARPLRERAEHAEALVAEEVAHVRQLEAACDQLQARLTRAEDDRDKLLEDGLNLISERDALQAENELLYRETRQLNEALGMARTEYGGKNINDLDEYDRLRITANAFKAMNGVLELQVKRNKARIELLTAALDTAIEALGWASDYVAVPWPKAYQVEPIRAALAAGITESEPIPLNEFGHVPLSYVFRNLPGVTESEKP